MAQVATSPLVARSDVIRERFARLTEQLPAAPATCRLYYLSTRRHSIARGGGFPNWALLDLCRSRGWATACGHPAVYCLGRISECTTLHPCCLDNSANSTTTKRCWHLPET